MVIDNKEIIEFTGSLPARCRNTREKLLRSGEGSWDTRVRRTFAKALSEWFCSDFNISPENVKDYIFVEGWNTIPKDMRGEPFFGTKMHPDAAIISRNGFSVAIELDHGTKGSQIRNALAKAAFSVLLGKFDRAILLFFWEKEITVNNIDGLENSEQVLKRFSELFQTTLYII